MNMSKPIAYCACLALAVTGIWFFTRSDAVAIKQVSRAPELSRSASVDVAPHPQAPFPEAQSAASVSDVSSRKAAVMQFKQSKRCYYAQNNGIVALNIADACKEANKRDGKGRQCESLDPQVSSAAQQLSQCTDEMATPEYFYEQTKRAAALGDPDAQVCYVQGQYQVGNSEMLFSRKDQAEYVSRAPTYIQSALERGDWRIVALLAKHGAGDSFNPVEMLTKGDPYRAYVMNRLLQLGADGAYAKTIGGRIQEAFLEPGFNRGPLVTPEKAAQGTEEAREMYRKWFAQKEPLKEDPVACTP